MVADGATESEVVVNIFIISKLCKMKVCLCVNFISILNWS